MRLFEWLFHARPRPDLERRNDPTCDVCGAPAVKFKALEPWPGSSYAHTSYTCAEHESYLHGHMWGYRDGVYVDGGIPKSSCSDCGGPYGECGCPRMVTARQSIAWEQRAYLGDVSPSLSTEEKK